MSRILPVPPVREVALAFQHPRHEAEHRAFTGQQAVELHEHLSRGEEMLQHLGADNEIVPTLESARVGKVKRIVIVHGVAPTLQQLAQGRARPAAEIEPRRRRFQALRQRNGKAAEESHIARVLGIVLMQIITGLFLTRTEPVLGSDEDQSATRTLPVVPASPFSFLRSQERARLVGETDQARGRIPRDTG